MNKKIIVAVSVLCVAIIIAGIIFYYNSQIANLKKAELVTDLDISEITSDLPYNANDPNTYNHLLIRGTVTNMGLSTAYNAGLHVVAVDATGEKVIDMTVPLCAGTYGLGGNQGGPFTLFDLPSKEIGQVDVAIYHKSIATTWTITPVWAN